MAVQATLTYEMIFDVLMREKSRDELQKLEESFFSDVAAYIQSKAAVAASDEEGRDRVLKQIGNIKRMLRELYERREKKIMYMSLAASRTSPSFIDLANMLPVERMLFEGLIGQLDVFRKNVLENVLSSKAPVLPEPKEQKLAKMGLHVEDEGEASGSGSGFVSASELVSLKSLASGAPEYAEPALQQGFGLVKRLIFLKPVPAFVGKELEVYGPFEPEQTAELPPELADVLISQGSANEVKE